VAKKESKTHVIKKELRSNLEDIQHNLTRKQYTRDGNRFIKYCREQHNVLSLSECKQYIQEYCDRLVEKGYSASTVHTYIAAACKACDVPMKTIQKPIRHSSEFRRGRSKTQNCKYQSCMDLDDEKWKNLVRFQKVVGLRRAEIAKLKGKDLVYDESGYLCIQVASGKGGKYHLQMIHPKHYDLVKSLFKDKDANELIFTQEEMTNKLNLHSLRAQRAREAYSDYLYAINNKPGYKEYLEIQILARWNKYNVHKDTGLPKAFNFKELEGEYHLRGKNREFAEQKGLPVHYNKLAVMATSIFFLSHWRNNVTITSYLLAV